MYRVLSVLLFCIFLTGCPASYGIVYQDGPSVISVERRPEIAVYEEYYADRILYNPRIYNPYPYHPRYRYYNHYRRYPQRCR